MSLEDPEMKIIAIAAVSGGGKTTVVNELKKYIPNSKSLHFDDYSFEGEVEDFYAWVNEGANYNVWNLKPLVKDICEIQNSSGYDYLILDYSFAYRNEELSKYIDCAIFINTPLDVAMARRVLRDMKEASAEDILQEMETYVKYARVAYIQMLKDILSSSDYVIDGNRELEVNVKEIVEIIQNKEKRI